MSLNECVACLFRSVAAQGFRWNSVVELLCSQMNRRERFALFKQGVKSLAPL